MNRDENLKSHSLTLLIKLNLCDKFFHRLMRSRCSQIKIEHFHARSISPSSIVVIMSLLLRISPISAYSLFRVSFTLHVTASHYFHSTFSPLHDSNSSLSSNCSKKHKRWRRRRRGKFMTSKQNVENIYDRVFVFRLNFHSHLFHISPPFSFTPIFSAALGNWSKKAHCA